MFETIREEAEIIENLAKSNKHEKVWVKEGTRKRF
jgi:hypothetical protein